MSSDDLDEMGRRFAGLLRRAGRNPADLLKMASPVPLVHVRCTDCGLVAGVIEGRQHGGQLDARIGRDRHQTLDMLACPQHGPLAVTMANLGPFIDRARTQRRAATFRAKPRSTP